MTYHNFGDLDNNEANRNAAGNYALQIQQRGNDIASNITEGQYEQTITRIDEIQQHLNSLRPIIRMLTGSNHEWIGVQQQSDGLGVIGFIVGGLVGFIGGVYLTYSGLLSEIAWKLNLPF
ncbi:MAG: hypothetical protein KDJ65_12130 [Anaerolineae bacterium]|nr:hypothetical protein [Anaerolineae bacterium]